MQNPIPRRKAILAVAAFFALSAAAVTASSAQGIVDLTGQLPLWEPGHAVTTSIKDALPVTTYLKVDEALARPIPDDWVMGPGYYTDP